MRRSLAGVLLMAACLAGGRPVEAQPRPFARLEGGMLNPDDPFNVAPGFGGAIGLGTRRGALLFRFVRQSWDDDYGSGRSHDRSFLLLDWERVIGDHVQPQPFFRVGGGAMLHPPLGTALALDAALGLRYQLAPSVNVVTTVGDLVSWLARGTYRSCEFLWCSQVSVGSKVQQNLSALVALEIRP